MNYDTKYQETGQILGGQIRGLRQEDPMAAMNACAKQAKAPQIGVSIERLEKACEELRVLLDALGNRLSPISTPVNTSGAGQEAGITNTRSPLASKIDGIAGRLTDMARATRNQIDVLEI